MITPPNVRSIAQKQNHLKKIAEKHEQARISRFGGSRRSTRRKTHRKRRA